ncbi:MAG: hypothetical protein WKF77_22560 [Planctomycetaceae bacterium]
MIGVFPELLVSLTIQCTLLMFITRVLVRRTQASAAADHLWSFCHLMILLLSLAGVLLPHARLFRGDSFLSLCHQATAFPVPQSFWTAVFWIWILAASSHAGNLMRSLFQISLLLRRATDLQRSILVDDYGNSTAFRSLADELQDMEVRVVTSESCGTAFCWQLLVTIGILTVLMALLLPDPSRIYHA